MIDQIESRPKAVHDGTSRQGKGYFRGVFICSLMQHFFLVLAILLPYE